MTTTVSSGFDPIEHGFKFRNRFSGLDILDEILDGLGDLAGGLGDDAFWSRWGLCGGMSWHALDRYFARNPVPATTTTPGRDSGLFRVLVLRQVDSLGTGRLIAACLRLQSRSDEGRWWDPRPSLRKKNVSTSWPAIQRSIDSGLPLSLTLVRGTTDPSENHQVVAASYALDRRHGHVDVGIYDPNHPARECNVRLELEGRFAGRAEQDTGEPLRHILPWPYDRSQRR